MQVELKINEFIDKKEKEVEKRIEEKAHEVWGRVYLRTNLKYSKWFELYSIIEWDKIAKSN